MLTLKAEASAGVDLRDSMLPDALDLARRTGARIEIEGNDTLFWIMPDDTLAGLQDAFDRLYPASRYVAAHIRQAAPRDRFPARTKP